MISFTFAAVLRTGTPGGGANGWTNCMYPGGEAPLSLGSNAHPTSSGNMRSVSGSAEASVKMASGDRWSAGKLHTLPTGRSVTETVRSDRTGSRRLSWDSRCSARPRSSGIPVAWVWQVELAPE